MITLATAAWIVTGSVTSTFLSSRLRHHTLKANGIAIIEKDRKIQLNNFIQYIPGVGLLYEIGLWFSTEDD